MHILYVYERKQFNLEKIMKQFLCCSFAKRLTDKIYAERLCKSAWSISANLWFLFQSIFEPSITTGF